MQTKKMSSIHQCQSILLRITMICLISMIIMISTVRANENQLSFNLSSNVELHNNDLISMNFYQTDIAIILQALADCKQMNLIMSENISIKQTIKLQNIDWQKALTIILDSANLQATMDDNILFISKAIEPEILEDRKSVV